MKAKQRPQQRVAIRRRLAFERWLLLRNSAYSRNGRVVGSGRHPGTFAKVSVVFNRAGCGDNRIRSCGFGNGVFAGVVSGAECGAADVYGSPHLSFPN